MYLSIYRYRVQELTVDQVRGGHSQDRQPGRTHVRAGTMNTQKGARRAQNAARRRLKGKG